MPYIKKDFREEIRTGEREPADSGELNYYITTKCLEWLSQQHMELRKVRYDHYNFVIGKLADFEANDLSIQLQTEEQFEKIRMTINRYIASKNHVYSSEYIFASVRGALRCAQFEMYRRLIAFYEDLKMKENGDVYPSAWSDYEPKKEV